MIDWNALGRKIDNLYWYILKVEEYQLPDITFSKLWFNIWNKEGSYGVYSRFPKSTQKWDWEFSDNFRWQMTRFGGYESGIIYQLGYLKIRIFE